MRQDLQIAIDGPAGVGKSTVGERLAKQLHYLYLDTGAMYRALAWLALQRQIDLNDEMALGPLAETFDLDISLPAVADSRQYTVWVDGRDVTWDLRSEAVDRAVSLVARHPSVRAAMRRRQQAIGERGGVVMVGRDIGTVVLPKAQIKILSASNAGGARPPPLAGVARQAGQRADLLRKCWLMCSAATRWTALRAGQRRMQ